MANLSPTASTTKYNNSNSCKLIHVNADSDESGHYIDDSLISEPSSRRLAYTFLAIPCQILIAGGALLD